MTRREWLKGVLASAAAAVLGPILPRSPELLSPWVPVAPSPQKTIAWYAILEFGEVWDAHPGHPGHIIRVEM